MQTVCAGIFVLCFVFGTGNALLQVPVEIQTINTPDGLGRHLEEQLARNETRFLISRRCFDHVREYVSSLRNGTFWALQMFDSNAKIPSGFLRAYLGGLGAFDQCLGNKSESSKLGTIRGKYCLGRIGVLNFNAFSSQVPAQGTRSPGQQRWLNFVEDTFTIPWAICLPDACSAKDFQFLHFLFLLRFTEDACQTLDNQTREFDSADIGAISFFGVIAALMVASTIYDAFVYYAREGKGSVLLRSFSMATNVLKIITIKEDENDISCLHGIRMINMFIVFAGLRYATYLLAPSQNWLDLGSWWLHAGEYLEAFIIIDTSFIISGMFISYNYLKAKSEGASFNIFVFYLNRIMRLTPGLAAMVLLHATLLRHMGSGPIWTIMRDEYLVNNCREYWWSALLYVQNYVNPAVTQICVLQTWQLSVDMQLFLLSPLILIPLTRAPKYTLGAVGSLLLCSIVSPFLAAWVYKLKAVIITNRSMDDLGRYVKHFYFPTHTRASPWIIGFILGYLLHESRKSKLKTIRKELLALIAILLWAIAIGLIIMCIIVGRELIGKKFYWLEHALHIAFIRPLWAVAVSWLIFACANGYGGPINSFLSLPFFKVLSRISYGTFLVFVTVMFILMYQTRSNLNFGNTEAWYRIFGDVIFCFALGFLWTLAFESPFVVLVKAIFGRPKPKFC